MVQAATAIITFALLADGILTAAPQVGDGFLNGSVEREVHVSAPSNNVAVTGGKNNCEIASQPNSASVTFGSNSCIVDANTPNITIVQRANEAA